MYYYIVPKIGTNEYRFAIDFGRLNQISARDNFPLPNISDTFDSLGMTKPKIFYNFRPCLWPKIFGQRKMTRTVKKTYQNGMYVEYISLGIS